MHRIAYPGLTLEYNFPTDRELEMRKSGGAIVSPSARRAARKLPAPGLSANSTAAPCISLALRSFSPINGRHTTRLILGSMPGAASLQAHEYYAHPRNAFWTIVESLLGIARTAPYAERVHLLASAGIAVWDVLLTCKRNGSLDSAIEPDGIIANDLRGFLTRNPDVGHIYFNGGAARALYDRRVLPTLSPDQQLIPRCTLPSTSPANARLSLLQKTRAWRVISQS